MQQSKPKRRTANRAQIEKESEYPVDNRLKRDHTIHVDAFSTLSESVWKFLDKPTSCSIVLPDMHDKMNRKITLDPNSVKYDNVMSISEPPKQTISRKVTPEKSKKIQGMNSLIVEPLNQLELNQNGINFESPVRCSTHRESRGPNSQRRATSTVNYFSTKNPIDSILKENISKTLVQNKLSRFLTEASFSCSSKKGLNRSVDKRITSQKLLEYVTKRPESLTMTLKQTIEERLSLNENTPNRTPNFTKSKPNSSGTKTIIRSSHNSSKTMKKQINTSTSNHQMNPVFWSPKIATSNFNLIRSPQKEKAPSKQTAITSTEYSFISHNQMNTQNFNNI